ncbi:nucleotide sugar dehydrogenase [Humisphaera borealis]|uniref:Nucleotide sugar dehydrogenase n=1 Tax=Humisphaera borealis TaxID=2807512 RepID=A0A7M2X3C7_9BACT|nr:nucleotide sugar dehydrogenase [Humisphaera borealis]QOV92129.1 nucleotide sugar dehydrogenase [Humisphaera borealis]
MTLPARIADSSAVVAVMGLGYVGLPLLAAFHRAGLPVLGFDIDPAKIDALRRGENYLTHLGKALVSDMVAAGRCEFTADPARLSAADAVIVCVPTPLGKHLEPDLTYITRSTDAIAEHLRPGQLIVLESSTYPRTTRDVMLPRLERGGRVCGKDFYLAYSPEREDPGRKDHSTQTIPKLVGGIDAVSGELAAALYRKAIAQVIPVKSAEVAEAAKILENVYRAVNIALVNEMKVVLTAMGIDVWEVIAAASTKPFGFQAFYPGPGLGGHCIPIDPYYLTWKAREVGMPTRFIELAGEVNRGMPDYVVRRTIEALNTRSKAVRGSRILVLGLAYKPDIDDVRESPSFELIEKLEDLGAEVDYSDPHVPATHKMRKYDLKMASVPLSEATLASYDCVIVSTHHSAFNWQTIADHSKLIVDTRNALSKVRGPREHIVSA